VAKVNDLQNFVGGQWTDLAFDKRADIIDPSTGEVFATAPVSGKAEVDAAFQSAADAFPAWRDATPGERSLALLKIADAIERRADEFVKAESQNTGKPIRSGSSRARPGCSRAGRPASTCLGSPRSSVASRWASAPP
jgi:acyl-CoA reductase-like NAD-dependent aldehyde dehydrogenase